MSFIAFAYDTNVRFAAFSMSSMHMNITSVFLRTRSPTAPRVQAGDPAVPVHEHEDSGERERAEHDRGDPLDRVRVVADLVLVDAQQRDDEQEEHHDRAGVDDDLDGSDERGMLLEIQHR